MKSRDIMIGATLA